MPTAPRPILPLVLVASLVAVPARAQDAEDDPSAPDQTVPATIDDHPGTIQTGPDVDPPAKDAPLPFRFGLELDGSTALLSSPGGLAAVRASFRFGNFGLAGTLPAGWMPAGYALARPTI